jgi:hypothetical protein
VVGCRPPPGAGVPSALSPSTAGPSPSQTADPPPRNGARGLAQRRRRPARRLGLELERYATAMHI